MCVVMGIGEEGLSKLQFWRLEVLLSQSLSARSAFCGSTSLYNQSVQVERQNSLTYRMKYRSIKNYSPSNTFTRVHCNGLHSLLYSAARPVSGGIVIRACLVPAGSRNREIPR